jgi:hypothetical protein
MMLRWWISLAVFVAVLLAVNAGHFRYFSVDVVLYGALADAAIAAIVSAWISWVFIFRRGIEPLAFFQLIVIFFLAGYIYAISVPTVIDRSLSMYILEKIQQRGGGVKLAAVPKIFTDEYLPEHRLVDVRLTEQLQSGTIAIENGCVKLTPRGERIANFTRWYRQHLLPKHRLLMGSYTDDLTDPFRHSATQQNYSCSR